MTTTESAFGVLERKAEQLKQMSEEGPSRELRDMLFDKYLGMQWAIEELRDHIGYAPLLDNDGYWCGHCNAYLDKGCDPCPECGKKVKWE